MFLHGFPALLLLLLVAETPQGASPSPTPDPNRCEMMALDLFGKAPLTVGGTVKEPKKVHNERPTYPEWPPGTTVTGVWLGELLLAPDGQVEEVFVLRDYKFEPAFPEFNAAISDAIHHWQYEPTISQGEEVPVCMTVSVIVEWR